MLSRRWIINFLLIVLIVLFTYIGNRFDVKTGYQTPKSITGLKPELIQTVKIRTADAILSLARQDGLWFLQSPIQWPANNISVERLLKIVSSESDSRLDAGEIDLATLGLDFPKAMLSLNDTNVLFGATNNIGGRRYTMIDSTVYLLPDIHLPLLSQGLPGVVDRRLLPRNFRLQSLKLPELEIGRDAGNQWQLAAPGEFTSQQIERLLGNWQGLEASRVRQFDSGGTPRQKIEALLEGGERQEFFLMSIDPEIVIANPGIGLQYHFRADLYYELIDLRDDENPA
ncbi:MAG: DUF4340 domain-containing protein [Gammaproteobacteria bacterium]|nr:DUF4340 domain-containing protein [Gammaproteobacteria bacterium]MDH3449939.1 DUF4340 domain-containing protein [Gammaproteobacteria bacterium]